MRGAFPVPLAKTAAFPPHPPRTARHLLGKEKAVGCGTNTRRAPGAAGGSHGTSTSVVSLRAAKKVPETDVSGTFTM